jgi:hypothetical protein
VWRGGRLLQPFVDSSGILHEDAKPLDEQPSIEPGGVTTWARIATNAQPPQSTR